ncbi:MAG: hypothetical protein NZ534_07110, partial [Bacteroidia bacterium]|nr:hypothetical protein [Bacteroidia bacterium]
MNGCQSSATAPVFVYPNPTVSVNVTPANPTGTMTVFFLSGAAPFDVVVALAGSTQTWTRNDVATSFVEFADMPAGAYLITVTDGNGCVARANAVINPPNCTLAVNAGTDLTVCSGSVNTLTATVAGAIGPVTYLWEPNLNLDNPSAPSVTVIPSATTIYTVTATSGVCFAQDAVAVNVVPEPALYASALQTYVCPGGGTVLTATGAESYVWEPGGIIAPSITVTPSATTTYTVTGTTQGCSKSTTVTVNVYPPGNLTLNAFPQVACLGQSVQLQAVGATNYLWTPTAGLDDATSPTPIAVPAQTTTYTVVGSDANGCPVSNFITVTVNTPPTAAPTASPAQICAGQTTTLRANASASAVAYEWQPASAILGPNNLPVVTAQPGATTTFTVRVRDAAGCEGTNTVSVSVAQLTGLNATTSQSIVCPGEPTTLFATGATSYVWQPATGLNNANIPNPVATVNETTTFTVTGTDPEGCTAQTTVTVNVRPAPVLTIANPSPNLCLGQSTTLSVSGAQSYVWFPITGLSDPNSSNPVAFPTTTTTYTVYGTDANGCVAQATTTVNVSNPPTVGATASPDAICAGQTTILSVPGFNSQLTYSWEPAAAIQGGNVGPTVVGAPLANTVYTVTARNAEGCSNTATVAVNVSNVVNLTAYVVPSQICAGEPVTLYATGATNYLWQPSGLVSQPTQAVTTANPTTTTTFTVTGYDPQGCMGQAQTTVQVYAPFDLTINASDATLCVGESATLTAFGAASYSWSPPAAVSNPTAAQVLITPASTTTYTVVGTDANGCSLSRTITITVVNPPNVVAGADASAVCANTTTTLFASGAANYVWQPQNAIDGPNVGASVVARPSQTTVYTVVGTDANGCSNTATVLVV